MASQAWLEAEHQRLLRENGELREKLSGQACESEAAPPAAQDATPPALPQDVVEELERLRAQVRQDASNLAEKDKEIDGIRKEWNAQTEASLNEGANQITEVVQQMTKIQNDMQKLIATCVPTDRQEEAKAMLTAAFA